MRHVKPMLSVDLLAFISEQTTMKRRLWDNQGKRGLGDIKDLFLISIVRCAQVLEALSAGNP